MKRKKWGQHFLKNPSIARNLVDRAGFPYRAPVIEIGAGYGALTRFLLEAQYHVIAVEIDPICVDKLRETFASPLREGDLILIHGNILSQSFQTIIKEYALYPPLYIIGNLPYAISSPIHDFLMKGDHLWGKAVLMFQAEFAERLVARSHTARYGALSVVTQTYWNVRTLMRLSPAHFDPPPEVASQVVAIVWRDDQNLPPYSRFRPFVQKMFRHKRKTLVNNVMLSFPKEMVEYVRVWLDERGFSITVRPQELRPEDFIELYFYVDKHGGIHDIQDT